MNRRWLLACVALLAPLTLLAAKDERWLRVSNPEFTVITSLPEREAKTWAGEFAQYLAALRALLNEKRELPPLTILLFPRDRDFYRFRPLNEQGKPKEVEGFFLRHESWAIAGMAGASQPIEVRRTVFHEGVHWFLSAAERPNPVWLEEGIAEVFSTFEVKPTGMTWGRPIKEHVSLLSLYQPLPLDQLLNTAHSDLFGDDSRRTSIVYAESWAFVHFLRFGRHDLPRDGLAHFVAALQNGKPQGDAFRDAFGKTYAQVEPLFTRYIRGGEYFVRQVDLIPVPEPKVEAASALDVEDAFARLALAGHRFEDAAVHAKAAIAASPASPRGHEILGLVYRHQEQRDAATAEFKRAVELGTRDFQPFFEVAAALQHETMSGGGTPAPAVARQIADYYEQAIDLQPRFSLSYENLAGVVGLIEPWSPKDREVLERGSKAFPGKPLIRVGLAILAYRSGDTATARAAVAEILRDSELKSSTRSYARQFAEAWERDAVLKEIERLADERKYAEALASVDRVLATDISIDLQQQLNVFRKGLSENIQAQALDAALRAARWAEARKIGNEILESNAAPGLKTQVRRTLEDLDRRKLGAPKD